MKKTNKYIYFKPNSAPEGLIAEVKYRVKSFDDEFYIIAGDIEVPKDREGKDYIIVEMQREGGKMN